MKDYIIVGQGIAGSLFAYKCLSERKKILVIDRGNHNASKVCSGLCNPVVLKRFTPVWNASSQLNKVLETFGSLEKYLNVSLVEKCKVYRIFHDENEQNTWIKKSKSPDLKPFLNPDIKKLANPLVYNPHKSGEVLHTNRVKVSTFLSAFRHKIKVNKALLEQRFEYSKLKIEKNFVEYKGIKARNIVFCEGFGIKQNPFFNYLPLEGNKGEALIIQTEELKLTSVLKSKVFVMPIANDKYYVGATYNRVEKNDIPTEAAKQSLLSNLSAFLKADFKIIEHQAAIRPTVKDRRPLVGQHPDFSNLYLLNGLGTRGLMIGSSMAEHLYHFIEQSNPLSQEINLNRFGKTNEDEQK